MGKILQAFDAQIDKLKAAMSGGQTNPAEPPAQDFVTINGIQVSAPCREPLNDREEYWIPVTNFDFFQFGPLPWTGGKSDLRNLKRGLIHRTPEAAAAMGRAMLNFNKP